MPLCPQLSPRVFRRTGKDPGWSWPKPAKGKFGLASVGCLHHHRHLLCRPGWPLTQTPAGKHNESSTADIAVTGTRVCRNGVQERWHMGMGGEYRQMRGTGQYWWCGGDLSGRSERERATWTLARGKRGPGVGGSSKLCGCRGNCEIKLHSGHQRRAVNRMAQKAGSRIACFPHLSVIVPQGGDLAERVWVRGIPRSPHLEFAAKLMEVPVDLQ